MALQSFVLASFLLLASAEVAFVQPNLQSTRPLRGVQQLASPQERISSVDEESPETASSWTSLLLGATLGLVLSLAGSMSASALYVPQRGDGAWSLNTMQNNDLMRNKSNPPEFRGLPEACSLRTYNETKDYNNSAQGRRWLEARAKDTSLKWFPAVDERINKCLIQEQTEYIAHANAWQAKGNPFDGKKMDPAYGIPTTAKDLDKKTGELYGARYGVNRIGFGHPGVGLQTASGTGTFSGGGGGPMWQKFGRDEKERQPYASMNRPTAGKENPALRAYAEGKGIATRFSDGSMIPNVVGWNVQYGKSATVLNAPFYKAKMTSAESK